ncbi:MAG TPA: ribonuclease III [Woeseiaceae bacterium]|nr:ribonuclease III [Woeseiaceae bacterium]
MKKAERWLEKTLHYRFQDPELFRQALSHRSATSRNNERLEFLGDAVLDFVISENLFRLRPDATEGDLSRMRALLVKDESLAALAIEIDLGNHLILGSGEMKTGGHRRESILADAVEAILGAVFLDSDFGSCRTVIENLFANRLQSLPDIKELRDPKTRLQEWLQSRKMALPAYDLVASSGQDHKQQFTVSCTVAERSVTTSGEASSLRKAEQKAARKMIRLLDEKPE